MAVAGDNLVVDLDLSRESLPAGTRLAIGTAVTEISKKAHRGCARFSSRFGGGSRVLSIAATGPNAGSAGSMRRLIKTGP